MLKPIEPKAIYIGTPVVLISTLNVDGSPNLAPISSVWWLGRTAVLGLGDTSHTIANLRRSGECVVNAVPSRHVDAVDQIALLTGATEVPPHKLARGYRYEPDKFGAAGLTPIASTLVGPPRVLECPLQFEATVTNIHTIGSGGSAASAVEVETVKCHAETSIMVDGGDHYVNPERWDPLIMKFCEFYGEATNLRESSLAVGWGMPSFRRTD